MTEKPQKTPEIEEEVNVVITHLVCIVGLSLIASFEAEKILNKTDLGLPQSKN